MFKKIFLFLIFPTSSLTEMKTTFFNVGEGLAILVQESDKSFLVDTGTPISATKLVNKIKNLTNGSIEAVFITHLHQDHIGGIHSIISELNVNGFYDNGTKVSMDEPYRWYEEEVRIKNSKKYTQVRKGKKFKFGNMKLEILSPKEGLLSGDWNQDSLVLRVDYGDFCMLFMGDALIKTEEDLLKNSPDKISCPVIQVGHHGSIYASSKEFIDKTHSKIGVISVNQNNFRGYPSSEVISKWENAGNKILQTKNLGDITLTSSLDGKYTFRSENQ